MKRKGMRKFEEIIVENFPKVGKEIATKVQETQSVPKRINPRWNTARHILIKLTKIKHEEQILKAAREKQQITHKGIPITADLSIETLQARREWQDILKVMKGKTNKQTNKKKPTAQITVPSKDLIQIWRWNEKLYRQVKAERIQHHQTSFPTNAKGSSLDRKHRKDV